MPIFSSEHLEPEPLLTCPQWAEENIILSRESGCSDPGKFSLSKMPHVEGPLASFSDPSVEQISLLFSAQLAKTTIIFIMLGYTIDCDPDPAMIVLPKDGNEKTWRDIRFKQLIRDTPAILRHTTGKEDDIAGDVFKFDSTFLKFASAGSPSALAETACRYIFLDEKNKYPPFSGRESSPSKLAKERAETFHNRKYVNTSTPTVMGYGISDDYAESDQRQWYCQCPNCGEYQILTFFKDKERNTGQIKWNEGEDYKNISNTQSAWYECGFCEGRIEEQEKWEMIQSGVWVQKGASINTYKEVTGDYFSRHHGYKAWRIVGPFRTFSDIASEFLSVKDKTGDLMNFYNSWLAEEWDEQPDKMDSNTVYKRREGYGPEIPNEVLYLTAWFDVQDDRLEGEILGHSKDAETFGIEYIVIQGSPGVPETWNILDEEVFKKVFTRSDGIKMKISAAGVDTGGHHFMDVCDFCRPRFNRINGPRVYATQGANTAASKPLKRLVMEPTRKNKGRVPLYNVDTSSFKKIIFNRLKVDQFGPKYMHFPLTYNRQYFMGLAESESLKKVTDKKGYSKLEWVNDPKIRNEPLDCRVGNLAVFYLANPDLSAIETKINQIKLDANTGTRGGGPRRSGVRSVRGGR